MILTRLAEVEAFRMHTPKWAAAPTSGAGVAMHGGRANRPGVPALYLALDAATAIKEYQQVSPLFAAGDIGQLPCESRSCGRFPARLPASGLVSALGGVLLRLA